MIEDIYGTKHDITLNCYVNNCKGHFILRKGKFGLFYGCSEYPNCRATRQYDSVTNEIGEKVYGVIPDEDILDTFGQEF